MNSNSSTSDTGALVEAVNLTKEYPGVTALNGCSMQVHAGEVLGLLGPNGAGKTTLLRLLLGMIKPTSGTATISGYDCVQQSVEVRKHVSYLPADARMFRQLRGTEVLEFFADVRPESNVQRGRQIAERLDLDLTRRVAYMSTGMRQKLGLAVTLAAEVPLLILDEPTANLDPTIRGVVSSLVMQMRDEGRAVLFSSHVMSEVEEVCDRVIIMRAGEVVHTQELDTLKRQHRITASYEHELPDPPPHLKDKLVIRQVTDDTILIECFDDLKSLLSWLSESSLRELNIESIGLRAVYEKFHPDADSSQRVTLTSQESIA